MPDTGSAPPSTAPPSTASTRPPRSGGSDVPDPRFWGDGRPRRGRVPRPRSGAFELLRARCAEWRGDARLGVALLAAVAVVAGLVWYRIGVGGSSDATPAPTATTRAVSSPTSVPASRQSAGDGVVVHVAGAVTKPGVVELGAGARVIDALEAAGGAAPDADLDRLNLAAKLADGERVLVQRVGEPLAAGVPEPGASGSEATSGLLNLNTATPAQLEELPGIGPVLAAAIIEERERRGGFRSVNELRDVRGIGEKRFEDLRDQVVV